MNQLVSNLLPLLSSEDKKKGRIIFLIVTLILFILAAGAPSAVGGVGG